MLQKVHFKSSTTQNIFVNQTKILEFLILREYKANIDHQLVNVAKQKLHTYGDCMLLSFAVQMSKTSSL